MRAVNQPRIRLWPWAAAGVLVIGNLFLHEAVSNACGVLLNHIGRGPYEHVMLVAVAALSAGGALVLLRGRTGALARPRVLACLLVLAAGTVAAQQWLLVSNVELVHFPQFGLLAALLLSAGLGPQATWIGATAAGVLDETYQHLVIYAQVPETYFDYNDIVLNAIGAAWVVVLAGAGAAGSGTPGAGRWQRRLLAALLAAFAVALWLAPPSVVAMETFPYWRPALARAATGLDYHVMSASEGLAALLLMWGLVVVSRGERFPNTSSSSSTVALALLLIGLVLGGCAARERTPPAAPAALPNPHPWPDTISEEGTNAGVLSPAGGAASAGAPGRESFIITFCCGPPLAEFTDARAEEIAAAGFNVVGTPCEGEVSPALNREALDVAARHGLTLWITDPRVDQYFDLGAGWEERLDQAVREYSDHPALGGYFLVDEPSAAKFADLAKVVARLREIDPQRVPYINLVPDFVSPDALGTVTYREHVERFMATVRPPLLSFDYYPFKNDMDRATFFDNLGLVRAVAQDHGVPFLLIVQAMPHGPYRDPTEAELAWQVNHALAFGARGISYFAYWTPVQVANADKWQFRHGLVEAGQPTEHFRQAARLNTRVRAYAAQLAGLRSIAVADSGGRFATPLPIGPIAAIDGGPVTAGFFSGGGTLAVMLVNQDYRSERQITLRLHQDAAPPEVFNPTEGRWRRLGDATLALAPGGARLLRWS